MKIISTIDYILSHPLNRKSKIKAISRFFKWQICSRINQVPIIYPFTDKSRIIIYRSMYSATSNLYCGLDEFSDMGFLLHFLREDDLFVDVGANIGSYTILSSAHVQAKTISIEPVLSTFSFLKDNISINHIESLVSPFQIAIGAQSSTINFTTKYDTRNHVAKEGEIELSEVSISTLDELLEGKEQPILLKIDVEGFESEVIKGAEKTLNNESLKAIIIELNGLSSRYNQDQNVIHNTLLGLGFKPYEYNPFLRSISELPSFGNKNTLYLRDVNFIIERIRAAKKVKVLDVQF